jgi:DNA-binding transcriptional ArsR family regulator
MPEIINLEIAAELAVGKPRLADEEIIDVLADNNTELKVLAQAPLREGVPVPLSKVSTTIGEACNGNNIQVVSSGHVNRVLRSMNPSFVEIINRRGRISAIQTPAGRSLSAATGGHLLQLAAETNIPLRGILGESIKPRNFSSGLEANGSIETRLSILTILWRHARKEWRTATELYEAATENDIPNRVVRSHLSNLQNFGVVERRAPKTHLQSERSLHGYLYRIKQENGHIPATEIVDRCLGIVVCASLMDQKFITSGLDHLERISKNPLYVPYLLRRSFKHSGHTGKKFK